MMGGGVWYGEGLRFACARCGNCCTGAPGVVRVTNAEIAALAEGIGVSEDECRATYTRRLSTGETSLRERRNGDCVFYHRDRGCTVYRHRPRQCRTWPFWRAVVATPERWAEAAKRCQGMNAGPLIDAATIKRMSERDGTSRTV
jgi:Fe-S-cluster containining protein